MTNKFYPKFQFMSGLPNSTVGAPSFSSSSRLQSNATGVLKQLYRFTGDCNYNAFPLRIVITKTPYYSMFMKYVEPKRNLQSNSTSHLLEWRRLLKHFNLSYWISGETINSCMYLLSLFSCISFVCWRQLLMAKFSERSFCTTVCPLSDSFFLNKSRWPQQTSSYRREELA